MHLQQGACCLEQLAVQLVSVELMRQLNMEIIVGHGNALALSS